MFAVGFLTGQEVDWLPHVTRILRADLPSIEFKVTSLHSPDLADALQSGELDLGFLRVEPRPDVAFVVIAQEPLLVILPSDHPLAAAEAVDPCDRSAESFIGFSDVPHVLRGVVESYFHTKGIEIRPAHRIDNFAAGIALVPSTRSVALLPAYVEPLLPWSVVSQPLKGEALTVDLAVGYRRDNVSPVLKTFLGKIAQLISAGPAGLRVNA